MSEDKKAEQINLKVKVNPLILQSFFLKSKWPLHFLNSFLLIVNE